MVAIKGIWCYAFSNYAERLNQIENLKYNKIHLHMLLNKKIGYLVIKAMWEEACREIFQKAIKINVEHPSNGR